jgi:ABC-type multidrug transport system fused ATPase/permease subunit
VLPDEYGVRESPFFFCHGRYWRIGARKPQNPDLSNWLSKVQKKHAATSNPSNKSASRWFKKRPSSVSTSSSDIGAINTDIDVSALKNIALDLSTPAGLRVAHLRKTFKDNCVAVNDSSFVMQYGELIAILGANGSGKSTTCHVLCGITPATAGDVLIDDQLSLLERHHRGQIGWCPQHDILFDDLTPVEHVPHSRWF